MRSFVGKMLNLIGTVGQILLHCFFIVLVVLTFIIKKTILGDFSSSEIDHFSLDIILALIVWLSYVALSGVFYVFNLKALISNNLMKLMFILSLINLVILIVLLVFSIIIKLEINMLLLYILGAIAIFFSLLILIGNLLNLGKSKL